MAKGFFTTVRSKALRAVNRNGSLLRYVSEELRGDREVVLAAVRQDWQLLRYASAELRGDR